MPASDYFKFNALIADPDLGMRMRLKQATSSVPVFGTVRQCGALNEAISHIQDDNSSCDVIFLSHRYANDEMMKFINEAKAAKQSQDAAFVLILKSAQEGSAEMAQSVAMGFDGFLVEPYSVNSLVEITNLAARVKKERGEARTRIAATMLLTDMMEQIDLVAYMKSSGFETGKSLAKLKEMAVTLQSFQDTYKEVCTDTMIRMFIEAPLPKKVFQVKKYGGVSSRVKKRMEQKILSEVETKKRESMFDAKIVKKN